MPRFLPLLATCVALGACVLLAACGEDAANNTTDTTADNTAGRGSGGRAASGGAVDVTDTPGAAADVKDGFETPGDWPPAATRRMREDHEPTPFSADQIAAACGPESKRVLRFEQPGRDTYYRLWTFSDHTAAGVTWHDAECDENGVENGTKQSNEVTWKELQSHASWPAENVTTSTGTLKTPAGTYECMHYVVKREGRAGAGEDKVWFAWDLPGPPVRIERYVRGTPMVTVTLVKVEGVKAP